MIISYSFKRVVVCAMSVLLLCGFDLTNITIPKNEILDGGPPKDGIPALTDPKVIGANEASYLNEQDRVIGLFLGGESKAYPIKILNWHEVINDQMGNSSVVVTYCPLCGTGMVFDALIEGARLHFGVSGKLYNSDVLIYDRRHESLWSQIGMKAVSGHFVGTNLKHLPAEHTTWKAWRAKYPKTRVLSHETGYPRDYSRDPYADYANTRKLMFPVKNQDSRLGTKDWVVGIIIGDEARAYPFSELAKLAENQLPLKDSMNGKQLSVNYDHSNRSAQITDAAGAEIPSVQVFWFAWQAFYPETSLYRVSTSYK